jgi:hypothetical protein
VRRQSEAATALWIDISETGKIAIFGGYPKRRRGRRTPNLRLGPVEFSFSATCLGLWTLVFGLCFSDNFGELILKTKSQRPKTKVQRPKS